MTHQRRMVLLVCLGLLAVAGTALGNDTIFYGSGDSLYPIQETQIRMEYERLIFDVEGDQVNVSVYFEFYNPGAEVTATVGFVAPPESAMLGGDDHWISDFRAVVNGEIADYTVSRYSPDGNDAAVRGVDAGDFLFTFPATFVGGRTVIEHSYHFPIGQDSVGTRFFDYRLRTGGLWAGGTIGEIEVFVFGLQDALVTTSGIAFEPVGLGRKVDGYEDRYFIKEGYLYARATDFRPVEDISIVDRWHEEIGWYDVGHEYSNLFGVAKSGLDTVYGADLRDWVRDLGSSDLRLLRNTLFAFQGYMFRSQDLRAFFGAQYWYSPDPNAVADPQQLTEDQREVLEFVQELER